MEDFSHNIDDVSTSCMNEITESASSDEWLIGPKEDVLLPEIDLYLECTDDLQYVIPDTEDLNSHALIGQNVKWKISFPTDQQSKEELTAQYLKCPECPKTFKKEHLFKHHLVSSHGKSMNFTCRLCDFVTKSNRNLQRHKRRVHFKKPKSKECNAKNLEQKNVKMNSQAIIAEVFANKFNNIAVDSQKAQLTGTMLYAGNNTKPCFENRSEEKLRNSVNLSSASSTVSYFYSDLSPCENLTGDSEAEKLDQCSLDLQDSPMLHGGIKRCILNNLSENTESCENGDFECFRCTVCKFACVGLSKTFQHAHKMLALCSVCNKTFSSVDSLRSHQKVAHHGVIPKQKMCPYAKYQQSFTFKKELTDHMQQLHPNAQHTCDEQDCQKTFKSEKLMQKHKRTHAGVHVCSWQGCGKKFRDNFNLQTHLSSHVGAKNRQCPHCSYTCVQKASMNWHLKKKHQFISNDETVKAQTVNDETINDETINDETVNDKTVNNETVNVLHIEIIKTC